MVRFVDYPEKEIDVSSGQTPRTYEKYYFVKHCSNPLTSLNSLRLKFLTINDAIWMRDLLKDFKGVSIHHLKKIKSSFKKYDVFIKLVNDSPDDLTVLENSFPFWIDIQEILNNYSKGERLNVFNSLIQKLNDGIKLGFYQPLRCFPFLDNKDTGLLVSLIRNSKEQFLKSAPKSALKFYGLL